MKKKTIEKSSYPEIEKKADLMAKALFKSKPITQQELRKKNKKK